MENLTLDTPGIGEEILASFDEPEVPHIDTPEESPVVVKQPKPVVRFQAVAEVPSVGGKRPGAGMMVVYWSPDLTNTKRLVANPAALQTPHMSDEGVVDGTLWRVTVFGVGPLAGKLRSMIPYSSEPKPGCWSWPKAGLTHAEKVEE